MSASERQWRQVQRQSWQRYGVWLAVALSGLACLGLTGAQPGKLFDRDGLRNASEILSGFAHPDLSAEFLSRIWALSIESLLIGILGTALAVILGTGLALLATRVPDLPDPPQRPAASWPGLEPVAGALCPGGVSLHP
jgi:phosphonate transport system permease protein